VPGQLSVVAVTDHENVPAACIPLTSVVLPADRIAAVAMEEAGRQLVSGIPAEARKVIIETKLIERMTCGPVPR
jgi:DNA-binding LacI/PurR family transcriptional regulator